MRKQFLLGLMAMLLPLTSWAADEVEVSVSSKTGETIVYAGSATQNDLKVSVTLDGEPLSDGDFTVYYTQEGLRGPVENAGNYVANVIITKAGSEGLTGAGPFTVGRRPLTKVELKSGIEAVTRKYNETDADIKLTDFFDFTGVLEEDEVEDAAKCLTLARKEGYTGDDAGEYRVSLSGQDAEGCNYSYTATGVTQEFPLIIKAQQLILVFKPHVYKGEEYEVETLTSTDYTLYTEYTTEEDNVEFTTPTLTLAFTTDEELLNVGSYTLNVETNNKNYQISEDKTAAFEISKAILTIEKASTANLAAYYGSGVPEDQTGKFTFKRGDTDVKEEVTELGLAMKRDNGTVNNKGTYAIHPYLGGTKIEEANYKTTLNNYEISYGGASFKINPRPFANPEGSNFSYELAENIDLTYQGKDFDNQDLLVVKYGETTLVPGTDYTLVFTKVGATAEEAAKNAGDKFTITVKAVADGNFTGEYEFTTEEEDYAAGFPIAKAELTIIAPDATVLSKVYDGEEIGDVTDLYEFEGLVGEDADEDGKIVPGKVLKMYSAQKDAGSSYIVHVIDVIQNTWPTTTGSKELKNYTFKYDEMQTKKFTILTADFELDGSKEDESVENLIAAYNGKKVEKVTVKNLVNFMEEGGMGYENNQTIKAKQWYTLVLPFDVKVRELSRLLGYAIVNVPNTGNEDPEKISFKLEMNEVPANTLMAFKVDEDITWDGEKPYTMTFDFSEDIDEEDGTTGREIKALTETIEDGAGNQFIGTYKLTTIIGEQDWYIWPTNGKWSDAATVFDYNDHGLDIYPLSGYVHFQEKTTNARIYMQEADGSTTAINAVTGETVNYAAEGWYSVDGVKLNAQPTQKGIYINNGKKVVIK